MSTPNFSPVPGATVSAAFYDPEENVMVVVQGVLEVEDDYYILRNPNLITPTGPQAYSGIVVLGRVGDAMQANIRESEKEVRPNTAATPTQAPVSPETPSSFTALDRCDRCGARAYVRAVVAFGESDSMQLLFCVHHGREHLPALREKPNVTITDESERLYAEVSQEN